MAAPTGSWPPAPSVPRSPAERDPTAVTLRRLLAGAINVVFWLAVLFGVFAATSEYVEIPPEVTDACEQIRDRADTAASNCFVIDDRAYFSTGPTAVLQWAANLALFVGIFVLWQGLGGLSVGHLLTGLRVVGEDGRPPGIGRALLRNLLWVADAAPWFFPLVAVVTVTVSEGHRRIGDLAAKTNVVRSSAAGAPVVTPSIASPVAGGYSPPSPSGPPGWAPPPSPDDEVIDQPRLSSSPSEPTWAPPPRPDPWSPATPPDQHGSADSAGNHGPPGPGPRWDAARNAYIAWDPAQRRWLQWDASGGRWGPIS